MSSPGSRTSILSSSVDGHDHQAQYHYSTPRRKSIDRNSRTRYHGQPKVNQHNRQVRHSQSMPNLIPLAEYAALPGPIQHKYFSPTERLRFAQQCSEQKRKKLRRRGRAWLSTSSITSSEQSKESIDEQRPGTSTGRESQYVTVDDALWFLTLPDKIKRHHLDRKEEAVLTERCEETLDRLSPDCAERSSHRTLSFNQDGVLSSRCNSTAPLDSTDEIIDSDSESGTERSFEAAGDDMKFLNMNFARPPSVKTTLTQNPTPPSSPPQEPMSAPVNKTPLLRTLSLRPLNLPPPRLAPPRIRKSPSPTTVRNTPSPTPSAARSSTGNPYPNFSRPRAIYALPPHPSINTGYHHNPDTNKITRHHFSTPENVEEAVKLILTPPLEPTQPDLPVELPGDLPGGYSFWDSDDDDSVLISDSSPSVPSNRQSSEPIIVTSATRLSVLNEYHHAIAECGSMDSGIGLPLQVNTNTYQGGHRQSLSWSNRETPLYVPPQGRQQDFPLLRQQSLSSSTNDALDLESIYVADPLALEALPISDDTTGAHGPFAVRDDMQSKRLKRVWKSMRRLT